MWSEQTNRLGRTSVAPRMEGVCSGAMASNAGVLSACGKESAPRGIYGVQSLSGDAVPVLQQY